MLGENRVVLGTYREGCTGFEPTFFIACGFNVLLGIMVSIGLLK